MAIISGKESRLGIIKTSAWGTETAVDKLVAFDSFDPGVSHTVLEGQSSNGLGQVMIEDQERGQTTITPSLTLKMRSEGDWEHLLAAFMGTAGVPTEQNTGDGDYLHQLTMATSNSIYYSLAYLDSSTTSYSYPSVAISGVTIDIPNPPGVMTITFNMVADSIVKTGATNTVAVLNALTAPTTYPLVVDQDDELLVNLESAGALSNSTDCVAIRSCNINYQRPRLSLPEVKCADGNAEPVDDGLVTCEVSLVTKGMIDQSILTTGDTPTYDKLSFDNQSTSQIGSGDNHSFHFFMPRGRIVAEPSRTVSNPGFNEFSYVYTALKASSNPTGMSSTFPYFELTNTATADYLA